MKEFSALRVANNTRGDAWCPDGRSLSFVGLELAGETGELLNVVKKLEREANGWSGSRATMANVRDELADVYICLDALADKLGLTPNDVRASIVHKFNETSAKQNFPHRLCITSEII